MNITEQRLEESLTNRVTTVPDNTPALIMNSLEASSHVIREERVHLECRIVKTEKDQQTSSDMFKDDCDSVDYGNAEIIDMEADFIDNGLSLIHI